MPGERFEYTLGEKKYIQKALVLGQLKYITKMLKGVKFPEKLDIMAISEALEDVISDALAVVLLEDGKESALDIKAQIDSEDVRKLRAAEFDYIVDSQSMVQIIDDFLVCNPVTSILRLISTVVMGMYNPTAVVPTQTAQEIGLTEQLSTSPVETLPSET